jgi:anthranilate synthase component 1
MKYFMALEQVSLKQQILTTITVDETLPLRVYQNFYHQYDTCLIFESISQQNDDDNIKIAKRNRYSIIAVGKHLTVAGDDANNCAYIINHHHNDEREVISGNPINTLEEVIQYYQRQINLQGLPSMSAGLFGYLGYEAVHYFYDIDFSGQRDDLALPLYRFILPKNIIVIDHLLSQVYLVNLVIDENDDYITNLDFLTATDDIKSAKSVISESSASATNPINHHLSKQQYQDMVEKCQEYIVAGDAFQIVPSQRFSTALNNDQNDILTIYQHIRSLNPSPYLFCIKYDDMALIGCSPETLVKLDVDDKITLRPIAGTRKRGADQQQDQLLEQELLADEKERAEHLMLLDLGRNDIGKVAKQGSINIKQSFVVEYYSHVMHIISQIEAIKSTEHSFIDVLHSAFPAGTVSGAPKIRAMEIIAELEREKRRFYAGGVGYFSCDGSFDLCIALRTCLVQGNTMYVQAGAGVVADSIAENEYQETINKAMALLSINTQTG